MKWSDLSERGIALARRTGETARRMPWRRIGLGVGGVLGVLVATLLLFVTFADWNAWRGPIGRFASTMTGRPVSIAGDLVVRPWSLTPRIEVHDLVIGDPHWGAGARAAWANETIPYARIPFAAAEIELLPLFTGELRLARLELQRPAVHLARDDAGLANWSRDPAASVQGRPLKLPVVRRFLIRDGQLVFEDARRSMRLEARIVSDESLGAEAQRAFQLQGEGALNRRPFHLRLTGGPLLNVRMNEPYAFRADLTAVNTTVTAAGSLNKPFDLSAYRANVRARGVDLADLYYIIGLSLPNTPPYRLDAVLARDMRGYTLTDVRGRVGDSDLAGQLSVATGRARPFVEAAFHSRSLDFDDIATVLGAPPSIARGETASPEQRAQARRMEAEGRLLPDARLDLNRVRHTDAHLVYRAARIVDAPAPIRAGSLDLTLHEGVMTMNPVRVDLTQGRIGGQVRIDARADTPAVSMDVRLSGGRIETFIPTANAISGPLMGRLRLSGRGATVRAAAATSDGSITFVTPRGEIRAAFAELTGVNVTRGLGLLLSHDQSRANVRCGVADFAVTNGVARPRAFVFDTEDVLIDGAGSVNLGTERLDLRLQGHPKEARLVRIMAPITITGPLRQPRIGVDASRALGQAGIAGLLASMVAPLAAVLPFVDAGLADDADCAALLGRAPARTAARAGGAG